MEYISGFLIILGNLRTDLSISYYLQEMVILIRLHLIKNYSRKSYIDLSSSFQNPTIEGILNF